MMQIQTLCVSPDGVLVLAFDTKGRCLIINKRRQALLHRLSFKGNVRTAKFSPDGKFIAIAVGKTVQVSQHLSLILILSRLFIRKQGCQSHRLLSHMLR